MSFGRTDLLIGASKTEFYAESVSEVRFVAVPQNTCLYDNYQQINCTCSFCCRYHKSNGVGKFNAENRLKRNLFHQSGQPPLFPESKDHF